MAMRRLLPASIAALAFFGAAALLTGRDLHIAMASLAFASTAVLAAQAFRGEPGPAGSLRDLVTLTKPRVMSLLLLTGGAAIFVGAEGVPAWGMFTATMIGLALACGGAATLNHYLDRDIDKLMGKRTAGRPVASGRIAPERALEFGIALSAASFVLLDSLVNLPTALLALLGNLFYVLVYTRLLKRSTPQNIVIGGAAGAVPPLVGYAAATGHLGWAAIVMFGIIFLWTPPHFWALALMIREHYANASVPMLPVVKGERETARQITLYTIALVVATLVPVGFGIFGLFYGVSALVLGLAFTALARLALASDDPSARGEAVPLLDDLPRAPLRGDGPGRGRLMAEPLPPPAGTAASHPPDLMHDAVGPSPELSRRNARLALGLTILVLLLFAGTWLVALFYNSVN